MPAATDAIPCLEQLLAELQSFLLSHEKSLTALKVQFLLTSTPSEPSPPHRPPIDGANVNAQLRALQRFLDSHLENVQALCIDLTGGPDGLDSSKLHSPHEVLQATFVEKEYKAVTDQLSVIMLTVSILI